LSAQSKIVYFLTSYVYPKSSNSSLIFVSVCEVLYIYLWMFCFYQRCINSVRKCKLIRSYCHDYINKPWTNLSFMCAVLSS
jgi:hypothetical protein